MTSPEKISLKKMREENPSNLPYKKRNIDFAARYTPGYNPARNDERSSMDEIYTPEALSQASRVKETDHSVEARLVEEPSLSEHDPIKHDSKPEQIEYAPLTEDATKALERIIDMTIEKERETKYKRSSDGPNYEFWSGLYKKAAIILDKNLEGKDYTNDLIKLINNIKNSSAESVKNLYREAIKPFFPDL